MNPVVRTLPLIALFVASSAWGQGNALDVTPLCDEVMEAVADGATGAAAAEMVRQAPDLRVKDFRCLRALVAPKAAVQAARTRIEAKDAGKHVDVWVLVKTKKRGIDKTARRAFGEWRVELSRARQSVHSSKGSVWNKQRKKRVAVKAGNYQLLKVRVLEPKSIERSKVEARVYRTLKKAGVKSVILRPHNWR